MLDCQWLQKLHTYGLLKNSFRPDESIRELRTYLRQRESLIVGAATCIQHMQKALIEMNLQLTNVLSDISGASGSAIIKAIIEGERDPQKRVTYLDIGSKFLQPDGSITHQMMPDGYNPAAQGYAIFADAIQPTINRYVSGISTPPSASTGLEQQRTTSR